MAPGFRSLRSKDRLSSQKIWGSPVGQLQRKNTHKAQQVIQSPRFSVSSRRDCYDTLRSGNYFRSH